MVSKRLETLLSPPWGLSSSPHTVRHCDGDGGILDCGRSARSHPHGMTHISLKFDQVKVDIVANARIYDFEIAGIEKLPTVGAKCWVALTT